jgi:23S rRNA (uridine2552-2'-O)-methyltransferase
MAYNRKDHFFEKAKKENFAARSIYKLDEIDQRFRLIKSGDSVLDLGCAPGSWSQYCAKKVGEKGRVLGVDLQSVKLTLPNALFLQADIHDVNWDEVFEKYGIEKQFDSVISDMAPRTTGVKFVDQARSLELCEFALSIAMERLKVGGHFICKLFHGEAFEQLRDQLRKSFEKVEILRPESTRKESKEIFLIGIRKKT